MDKPDKATFKLYDEMEDAIPSEVRNEISDQMSIDQPEENVAPAQKPSAQHTLVVCNEVKSMSSHTESAAWHKKRNDLLKRPLSNWNSLCSIERFRPDCASTSIISSKIKDYPVLLQEYCIAHRSFVPIYHVKEYKAGLVCYVSISPMIRYIVYGLGLAQNEAVVGAAQAALHSIDSGFSDMEPGKVTGTTEMTTEDGLRIVNRPDSFAHHSSSMDILISDLALLELDK